MTHNIPFPIFSEILSYLSPHYVHLIQSSKVLSSQQINQKNEIGNEMDSTVDESLNGIKANSKGNQSTTSNQSSPTFLILSGPNALKYIRSQHPIIDVYYNVIQYYSPKAQYIGFKLFVEILALIRDSETHFHGTSPELNPVIVSKVIPQWKCHLLKWLMYFQNMYTSEMPIELVLQTSVKYLKFFPPSTEYVEYKVEHFTHPSLHETKIRILRNGIFLHGKICSSSDISIFRQQPSSAGILLITWAWRFDHIFRQNQRQMYQFFEQIVTLLMEAGIRAIVCTDDPMQCPVAIQCLNQHNITVIYDERIKVEEWEQILGPQAILQSINSIWGMVLSKKQNTNSKNIFVGVEVTLQVLIEEEEESMWIIEQNTDSHNFATILVLGGFEQQVVEIYQEIHQKLLNLYSLTSKNASKIQTLPGDCFFEGNFILYLRQFSKDILFGKMNGENLNNYDIPNSNHAFSGDFLLKHNTPSVYTIAKLNQILANIIEEEPLHIVRNFTSNIYVPIVMKQWYNCLMNFKTQKENDSKNASLLSVSESIEISNNPSNSTKSSLDPFKESIFLTSLGLQCTNSSIQVWKETFHTIQSILELTTILLNVQIKHNS